ncbi:Serine threonine- kinase 36 [Pelomyxa schiedti]|nr:Serine threonine- kinase 36 [Pelomyxa schiedti]
MDGVGAAHGATGATVGDATAAATAATGGGGEPTTEAPRAPTTATGEEHRDACWWDDSRLSTPLVSPNTNVEYDHADPFSPVQLGKGGFGVVYCMLRKDVSPYTKVAVKLIFRYGSKEDKLRARTEGEITRDIDHPNLLTIYDSFEVSTTDGSKVYCVISEFCERGDFRSLMERDLISDSCKPPLLYAITGAVMTLHHREIAHRDLKLKNVLCTADCVPKLCDFGVAKRSPRSGLMVSFVGTRGFVAPEMTTGEYNGMVADMFSLGVLFLEVLTGHDCSSLSDFTDEKFMHDEVTRILLRKKCDVWVPLVLGMLCFDINKRLNSTQVMMSLHKLPECSTEISVKEPEPPKLFFSPVLNLSIDDSTFSSEFSATLSKVVDIRAMWKADKAPAPPHLPMPPAQEPQNPSSPPAVEQPVQEEVSAQANPTQSEPTAANPSDKKDITPVQTSPAQATPHPHQPIRQPSSLLLTGGRPLPVPPAKKSTPISVHPPPLPMAKHSILTLPPPAPPPPPPVDLQNYPAPPPPPQKVTTTTTSTSITPRSHLPAFLHKSDAPTEPASTAATPTPIELSRLKEYVRVLSTDISADCKRVIGEWLQLLGVQYTDTLLTNGCALTDAVCVLCPAVARECAAAPPVRNCVHIFHVVANWAHLLDLVNDFLHIKTVGLTAVELAKNRNNQVNTLVRLLILYQVIKHL